jgi:hypothetical protein
VLGRGPAEGDRGRPLSDSRLFLLFCPYLPVPRLVTFGPWCIGPIEAFEGRWINDQFEAAAKTFLSKFNEAASTKVIKAPSILARAGKGPDGQRPSREEHRALRLAISFACLNWNVRWTKERASNAWSQVTADNAELFVWPLDVEGRYVTLVRGSVMLETTSGGWQLDDKELRVSAPLELHIPSAVSLDVELLSASYDVFYKALSDPASHCHQRRLLTAATWFDKAWRNTPSLEVPERIVFLKTGFEALTGKSDSRKASRKLRTVFETLRGAGVNDMDELLWSEADVPDKSLTWLNHKTGKLEPLTPFEHWFLALARARNDIVHGSDAAGALVYQRQDSQFGGSLLWTAEWLLRSAIKIRLQELGYPDLWRSRLTRASAAVFKKIRTAIEAAEPDEPRSV